MTYAKDGWVVWNPGRLWLSIVFCLFIGNADIVHITAAKDNVLVDIRGRWDLLGRVLATALGTE